MRAGRLGEVRVFDAPARSGLVFLFSDDGGWSPALAAAARSIASAGALVVGVDLPSYRAGLAATTIDRCHYTVGELEDWSHRLQREAGFAGYRSPVLAGVGAGGALAYAALAQAPAATVAGAVAVAPAPVLATRVPLCPGAASRPEPGGFAYAAGAPLPGFWRVEEGAGAPPEERVAALVVAALAATAPDRSSRLSDLPLVELPAPNARLAAVIYSGDGGWRDLDKDIAETLARSGVACVGVDSLRYFWREKSPETVAADLARILAHVREAWGVRRFVLVGYSFGAGVVPFAYNRLPAAERAAVVQLSLLGLAHRAPFEFAVTGWIGKDAPNARPVLPELERLDLSLVQCVYGEEEDDTLCTDPALAGAERIGTSGGHHFDGDYTALAQAIRAGAERRAAAAGAHFETTPPRPPEMSDATLPRTTGSVSAPGEAR